MKLALILCKFVCFSVFIIFAGLSTAKAQACLPNCTGSALGQPTSTSTSSGNSTYYPDPVIVESYVPPSQDYCNIFRNTDTGCSVECRTRSESKCVEELIVLSFQLHRENTQSFTVTRRGNESDAEFFERYNLESVNRMLKAGVDPNSIEAKAALLSAVANGNDEISRRLINAGIRIDPVEGGKVLLATYDRTRMLELIKLGADVNAEITRGSGLTRETPLWNAVQNNDNMDLEVVEAMVKAGAHANKRIRTEAETTPFLETLNNNKNRLPIIKMFIAAGADAKDTYSQYLSFDEGDDKANTLILAGCQEPDSPELIKLLLDAGANPNYHYYDKPSDKNVSVLKYFKDRTCPYKNQVISILKQAGAK